MDEGGAAAGLRSVLRPFYFIVVFWGERFRNYLIDYCLPSLLAPNNIPRLEGGRRNRFVFCTTPDDWTVLRDTPIFALLERHIDPHFIEIPPAPPGRSGCEHMGVGHKAAARLAHRDRAYGVFVTPDFMISDGSVAALERYARAGRRVVLSAALRFGEEPLFANLRALGVIAEGERLSQLGRPLVVTGRQLVGAGIKSFHSQTQRYEFDAPWFSNFPVACWWRVPGEDGVVLHSLSWCPLLLDYAAVERHDTTVLDSWTLDADYVYRNFGDTDDIHVVVDSDEMILVSWAPLADRPHRLSPSRAKALPVVGEWLRGAVLRGTVMSGIFDPQKVRIFFRPVRWHARDLAPVWEATEARAARILRRFVGDLEQGGSTRANPPVGLAILGVLGRAWVVTASLLEYRARLAERLGRALCGDRVAFRRIWRRVRMVWRSLRGVAVGDL